MPVVLLATDADQLHDEVDAALGDETTTVHRVRAGREVIPAVKTLNPDLVVLDLQIGNMGGMATCLSLRSEEGAGRLAPRAVLMLLDRTADVFLAKRSDADGWLVKPLDAFRLRRAADALLAGGEFKEGSPVVAGDGDAEPENVVRTDEGEAGNPAEPVSGTASEITEGADEPDDTAMDTEDNAEADESDDHAPAPDAAEG